MLALVCSNDHNMLGNVAFTVIPRGVWVWYLPKTLCETTVLSRSSAMMALDEYRPQRKCITIATALCHLENTPRHISKNRELKQWGRERRREGYKTIDLITEYNHFLWECNHLVHRPRELKKCWHMLGKRLTGFKLDATYANIMQHIAQQDVQTNATCCAQHVGTACCVRLHGP